MPNLGFQFEVLKHVITERAAGGDPVAVTLSHGNFNNATMPFAVLGAMGPDVLRYVPISPALASFLAGLVPPATSGTALSPSQTAAAVSNATTQLQGLTAPTATPAQQALAFELYFNPLGAAYSVLFSSLVIPLWPILNHVTDVLDQLQTIVTDQDEIALASLLAGGSVQGLENLQSQLVGLPATIAVMQIVIGAIVSEGPWMEMNQTFPPAADVIADRRYEFLRWHLTGEFARNLLQHAKSANQKAFAFGWLSHVSSSVTAEPFVNNVVGGPYRTHWWRNRLAGNFVDSWTFGFFEQNPLPTMAGDNPTPAYADPNTGAGWPSICEANLQNLFNVAGLDGPSTTDGVPDAVTAMATGNVAGLLSSFPFPAEISKLLDDTIAATYAASMLPTVGLDANGHLTPAFQSDTFARAYLGAFAVYWFMTSGSGPIGNNPTGTPTGMPEPTWISSGGSPSSPQQAGVNVGAAVCAALLAIFAIFSILTGDFVAGAAALVAALAVPVIDWPTVANELFWLRKTLVDQENLLRDSLVMSGLAYPPPVLLGAIDPDGNTLPATDLTPPVSGLPQGQTPATAGVPLCKTNALSSGQFAATYEGGAYPRRLDATSSVAPVADVNFAQYPLGVGVESEATDNGMPANLYPNTLIASMAPVLNGGMLPWPTADKPFGDAVANAMQIIAAAAKGLPDYNLDGDRGYGWQTWDPTAGSNPFNPPVAAMAEP